MKSDTLKNVSLLAVVMLIMFATVEVYFRSAHKKELQAIASRHAGRDSLKTVASHDPRLIYTI